MGNEARCYKCEKSLVAEGRPQSIKIDGEDVLLCFNCSFPLRAKLWLQQGSSHPYSEGVDLESLALHLFMTDRRIGRLFLLVIALQVWILVKLFS